WVGDAMGDLVAAPLFLAWAAGPRGPLRAAEACGLFGSLVVVSVAMFSGRVAFTGYPYLIFPFLVWAALRFGLRGTTTVTFCVSALAIWCTVNGLGPFATETVNESLVRLQLFMAVIAMTGVLLAAAISERDRAERERVRDYARLQESEQR